MKLTSRSACTPAKLLLTPRISSIAAIGSYPAAPSRLGEFTAFSSEVDTGSLREKTRQKKKLKPAFRFDRNAGSSPAARNTAPAGRCHSLELRLLVVAAVDQRLLPIAL